jgi:hypothetical protein
MNRFDHLSEDLTIMLMEVAAFPDQPGIKRLIGALTRAHQEACEMSQAVREDGVAAGQTGPMRTLAA